MPYITEKSEFTSGDVPLLDTTTPIKGYDGTDIGPSNEQAQVLANRTLWLKDGIATLTTTTDTLAQTQTETDKRVNALSDKVDTVSDKLDTVDQTVNTLSDTVDNVKSDTAARADKLTADIQSQKTHIDDVDTTLSKKAATLEQSLADQSTRLETVTTALNNKQDALVSGKTINTVFGQSLTDVKEGGITLSDASDFATILKSHLAVADGLSLDQSEDGQILTFSARASGDASGSTVVYYTVQKAYANAEVEFKHPKRPDIRTDAYALKQVTVPKPSDRDIPLASNPSAGYSSKFDGAGTKRITILPDTLKLRLSSLTQLTVDDSVHANTKIAFSADGENWYTLASDGKSLLSLGNLQRDSSSATQLVEQGITLTGFNAGDKSLLPNYFASSKTTPYLNLAFAAVVNSDTHAFVPDHVSVAYKDASGWQKQPISAVDITFTADTIIFKPTATATYAFCYAFFDTAS